MNTKSLHAKKKSWKIPNIYTYTCLHQHIKCFEKHKMFIEIVKKDNTNHYFWEKTVYCKMAMVKTSARQTTMVIITLLSTGIHISFVLILQYMRVWWLHQPQEITCVWHKTESKNTDHKTAILAFTYTKEKTWFQILCLCNICSMRFIRKSQLFSCKTRLCIFAAYNIFELKLSKS